MGIFSGLFQAAVVTALNLRTLTGRLASSAVAVIGMTVLLSVLAHGLSAKPLAARYGRTGSPFAPGTVTGGIASLAAVPEGIGTQMSDQLAVARLLAEQSRVRRSENRQSRRIYREKHD